MPNTKRNVNKCKEREIRVFEPAWYIGSGGLLLSECKGMIFPVVCVILHNSVGESMTKHNMRDKG